MPLQILQLICLYQDMRILEFG